MILSPVSKVAGLALAGYSSLAGTGVLEQWTTSRFPPESLTTKKNRDVLQFPGALSPFAVP